MSPTTESDVEPKHEPPRHCPRVPPPADFPSREQDENDTAPSVQSALGPDFSDNLLATIHAIILSLNDTQEDIAYKKYLTDLIESYRAVHYQKFRERSPLQTFLQGHRPRSRWIDIVVNLSASPSQAGMDTVSFGKLASLMDFEKVNLRTFNGVTREPFRVQPPVNALLNGSMKEVLGGPGSIQWIHLPANNMSWVEALMKRLYRDNPQEKLEQIPYDQVVLSPQNWTGRQNNDFPHARFMRPTCSKLPAAPDDERRFHGLNMAFFMPYLHWETDLARLRTAHLTKEILSENYRPITDEDLLELRCNTDEKLLRKYLNQPSPLHARRALHQAYYTPTGRYKRERSQATIQHIVNNPLNKGRPHVLMVDQCWLWVIGDMVVTCFPGCWIDDGYPEAEDPIDLLEKIVHQLSQREIYETISSCLDLATIIMDSCAGNMMEPNIYQNQDHEGFHFLELFYSSIRRVMVDQTILFDDFCDGSRRLQTTLEKVIGAIRDRESGIPLPEEYEEWEKTLGDLQQPATGGLSDITQEITNLREIKDISDELRMIEDVISQQQLALNMFHDIAGRKKWAADTLLQNTRKRKETIEQLHKDASHTYSQIVDLLDLKQKQTNVSEARSSRFQAELANKQAEQAALQAIETTKQGKSIMLFTTVTILFLPLSTVASLFSLNAKELNGGNLRISIVFAYLFPISFFIVIFALLLAFHTGLRQLCTLYTQIALAYLDHSTGFSKVVRQDNNEKIEELRTRLESIKAKSRGEFEEESEYTVSIKERKWKTFLADRWSAIRWRFRELFRRRRPHTPDSSRTESSDRNSSLVDD
ncbi:hypothetical protein DL98DRAFT_51819 [Cadophora sp. DSE1049]|nr:hypothetical protein DL98DRAFT_51819 [Cadophora sp. DSE1049]